jgi:hypothetical protein
MADNEEGAIPTDDSNTGGGGAPDSGAIADDSDGASAAPADPKAGGGDSNGTPEQNDMSEALNSVDQVMQYMYQQHGLSDGGGADGSGGQQMLDIKPRSPDSPGMAPATGTGDANVYYPEGDEGRNIPTKRDESVAPGGPDWSTVNQSPNVDDRRNQTTSPLGLKIGGALNNFAGKAYGLYDQYAGDNGASQLNNPMSRDLGIHQMNGPRALAENKQAQGGAISDTED